MPLGVTATHVKRLQRGRERGAKLLPSTSFMSSRGRREQFYASQPHVLGGSCNSRNTLSWAWKLLLGAGKSWEDWESLCVPQKVLVLNPTPDAHQLACVCYQPIFAPCETDCSLFHFAILNLLYELGGSYLGTQQEQRE